MFYPLFLLAHPTTHMLFGAHTDTLTCTYTYTHTHTILIHTLEDSTQQEGCVSLALAPLVASYCADDEWDDNLSKRLCSLLLTESY